MREGNMIARECTYLVLSGRTCVRPDLYATESAGDRPGGIWPNSDALSLNLTTYEIFKTEISSHIVYALIRAEPAS